MMTKFNSTIVFGVSQTYLDFVSCYGKYVQLMTRWCNTLCHRNVEEVIFESKNVALDYLTITDKNVTVDIMFDLFNINESSFSRVNMFYPLDSGSFIIFSKNPLNIEKNGLHNYLPIKRNVYLCLLASMCLISYVLTLIKYKSNNINCQVNELANVAAILARQGDVKRSESLPYQVLLGSWLLVAFLLSVEIQTYLNCEFANIQHVPMDTLVDVLANLDRVQPIVFEHTYIEGHLKDSKVTAGHDLWQYLNDSGKFLRKDQMGPAIDSITGARNFAFLTSESSVYLLGMDLLNMILTENDQLHKGPPMLTDHFSPAHGPNITATCKEHINRKNAHSHGAIITGDTTLKIIALEDRSPFVITPWHFCLGKFNCRFIKMQEMKLFESEEREAVYTVDKYKFRPSLDQQEFVLNWGEFKSTELILGVGFLTALIFSVFEYIYKYAMEKEFTGSGLQDG